MSSAKELLRLAEQVDRSGRITRAGEELLVNAVQLCAAQATAAGCEEVMAFATSALREAVNSSKVLARVERETGVTLTVLSGVDEARLTFLAVRRWCGWSAGRILALDIGGGSLELATGLDEDPDVAVSVPLGAGRVSRERLPQDPPDRTAVAELREWLAEQLRPVAVTLLEAGGPEKVVATSKTFRSLARLAGAAPSAAGPRVRRALSLTALRQLIAFISRMTAADRAELDGVSSARSQQLLAGALVAEASMRALGVEEVEICPWALREGVILRRLDTAPGAEVGAG